MHRACWPRHLARERGGQQNEAVQHETPEVAEGIASYPSLAEICAAPVSAREFVGDGLLPLAEREFLSCVAKAVMYNRKDAWDHESGQLDTPERQRSRAAWMELMMFPKVCLPALPGGKAKEQRNRNIVATRLERWANGERATLWKEEVPQSSRQKRKKPTETEMQKENRLREECVSLAERGLAAKAVNRVVGPGPAPDTPEVEAIMRSKFIQPPQSQANSRRPPAPPSNVLSEECVAKAALSFARGAGPGPTGLRPDFVKQIIGDKGEKRGIGSITQLCNLLADGQAPPKLAPFLAGANGNAMDKKSKTGEQDARPVCSGDYWRRLVGKALLSTELENLRDHLLPHQLAVGVPCGVEVMPHLARLWLKDNERNPDKVLLGYDEGNAHNEVDRHLFLKRMWEVAPGLARWLEYI